MDVNASTLNRIFAAHMDTPGGKEKIAQAGQKMMRDHMREGGFARQILPMQQVTRADVQVSTRHDTPVYIAWIEPHSRATTLTFRGQPEPRYIRGERYEIPFWTIATERFEKSEDELFIYPRSIVDIIKEHGPMDMQAIEDYWFLVHVNACITATELKIQGIQAQEAKAAGETLDDGNLLKRDLVALFQVLDNERCGGAKTVLLNEIDWDSILNWTIEDTSDAHQERVLRSGLNEKVLMGKKIVRTIKTDLLQRGDVYAFAEADMFGHLLSLFAPKFWADKVGPLIMWQSWYSIGMGFGGIKRVAKLELYRQSDDSSKALISEAEVESREWTADQVAARNFFPQVNMY